MSSKSKGRRGPNKLKSVPQPEPQTAPPKELVEQMRATSEIVSFLHHLLMVGGFKPDQFQMTHRALLWLEELSKQTKDIIDRDVAARAPPQPMAAETKELDEVWAGEVVSIESEPIETQEEMPLDS